MNFVSIILLSAQKGLDHSSGDRFSKYNVPVLTLLYFMSLLEVITFALQFYCTLGKKNCIYTAAAARSVNFVGFY